jgi:hypothetical protein
MGDEYCGIFTRKPSTPRVKCGESCDSAAVEGFSNASDVMATFTFLGGGDTDEDNYKHPPAGLPSVNDDVIAVNDGFVGGAGTKTVGTWDGDNHAHKVASDHDSDRDGFAFANLAGPRKAQDVDFLDNHDQGAFHLAAHSEAPHFGQVHFDWVEWTSHPRSDFFHLS